MRHVIVAIIPQPGAECWHLYSAGAQVPRFCRISEADREKQRCDLNTFSCGHTFACPFDAPELLKPFLSGYGLLLLQFGDVIISGEQLVEGQQSKHKRSQIPNAESNLLMCLHLHINKRKNTLMGWLCRRARRQQMHRDNRKISVSSTQSDFLFLSKVGQELRLFSTSCHHGF